MTPDDRLFSMLETTFGTLSSHFQYFKRVLNNSKMKHETMAYINAESIKECSLNRNKVNVTRKPFLRVIFPKYQSIALTEIM